MVGEKKENGIGGECILGHFTSSGDGNDVTISGSISVSTRACHDMDTFIRAKAGFDSQTERSFLSPAYYIFVVQQP